jgi:dTDP-4-amino-4,6-dideoxygalactose transaminase
MPSFTFVGTAVAAEHCGYAPYFVDVDPADWILDPLALANHQLRDRTGVVIPVAAFGRPVRAAAWQRFRRDTHIPVVIDGAACFEALTSEPDALIADVPVAVSFHATKSFGVGEGGCVVSRDAALIERVARALNFGFSGSRISSGASANGKMSEYHAAVGLAALDVWSETQASLRRVADEYRSQFADANLQDRFVGAPTVAGCYALFQSASATEAKHVRQCLTAANVDFRLWYGEGLHRQPAFADAGHDDMPTTGTLAEHILGLPAAVDLTSGAISRVVAAIIEAVAVDINAL